MSIAPATRVAMVRPFTSPVVRGVAPLRSEPDDAAELVDEAQYGERMTRLGARGEWTYVQGRDLYFGWVRTTDLGDHERRDDRLVAVPLAAVRSAPDDAADMVDELPAGVSLGSVGREGVWSLIGLDRWIRTDQTIDAAMIPERYPTAGDLLATATGFLGVPYLWGGTSAHGIDCSGFTQQVYRLNGVGLVRDADQQALGGRPVDQARPGDLFFFGADRVTHTAIATGERAFIHAPQSGMSVQRGELTDPADVARLRAIRRYLP